MSIDTSHEYEYFGIDVIPNDKTHFPPTVNRMKHRFKSGLQQSKPAQVIQNKCPLSDMYLDFHVKIKGNFAEASFYDGEKGTEFFCRMNIDGNPAKIYHQSSGAFRKNETGYGRKMQVVAYDKDHPGIVLKAGYDDPDIPSWQVYVPAAED